MTGTPEELALDLSRASVQGQETSESQIHEKATALLAAASIAVPAAALAAGRGPAAVVIPFGVAAVAYALCVRECGAALLPRGVRVGLLGSELLETVNANGADLNDMQAIAAACLDQGYKSNQVILEAAAKRIERAIVLLTAEIVALVIA